MQLLRLVSLYFFDPTVSHPSGMNLGIQFSGHLWIPSWILRVFFRWSWESKGPNPQKCHPPQERRPSSRDYFLGSWRLLILVGCFLRVNVALGGLDNHRPKIYTRRHGNYIASQLLGVWQRKSPKRCRFRWFRGFLMFNVAWGEGCRVATTAKLQNDTLRKICPRCRHCKTDRGWPYT